MSFLKGKEKSKLTWRAGKLTRSSRSEHHYRWVANYREPIMDPTGVINTLWLLQHTMTVAANLDSNDWWGYQQNSHLDMLNRNEDYFRKRIYLYLLATWQQYKETSKSF